MRYITTAERIGMKKGRIEGKIEGKIEEKKETAKNMLKIGMDIGLICRMTGLSEEEVRNLPGDHDITH